jgi:hypothetical protein
MRHALITGVALAALVALPAAGRAQAKTNFAGSWTFDQAKSDPAPAQGRRGGGAGYGGRGGGAGVATSLTIEQTPTQITIERAMGPAGTTSAVYKLDGSESSNALGDVFLSRSKVSWEGPNLVITTVKDQGQGPNGMMSENSKEVYSLEGGVLTVTTTLQVMPSTPNSARTRKLVYNKKS